MKQVAKNDCYEIAIDESKNRIYLKVKGFWPNVEVASGYLPDWERTIALMRPGFTIVSDLIEMKPPPTSVAPLHERAQRMLVQGGLSLVAEVIGEAALLELQLRRFAERSQMNKCEFKTSEDAEAWLDSRGNE